MRLPRMTTRRWMILVAVLGVVMGVIAYAVRLARLRDYYFNQSLIFHVLAEDAEPSSPREAERLRRLWKKYENAARYPWLRVEPDPRYPWLRVEPDPPEPTS
jgi:hypothetical protein